MNDTESNPLVLAASLFASGIVLALTVALAVMT